MQNIFSCIDHQGKHCVRGSPCSIMLAALRWEAEAMITTKCWHRTVWRWCSWGDKCDKGPSEIRSKTSICVVFLTTCCLACSLPFSSLSPESLDCIYLDCNKAFKLCANRNVAFNEWDFLIGQMSVVCFRWLLNHLCPSTITGALTSHRQEAVRAGPRCIIDIKN